MGRSEAEHYMIGSGSLFSFLCLVGTKCEVRGKKLGKLAGIDYDYLGPVGTDVVIWLPVLVAMDCE